MRFSSSACVMSVALLMASAFPAAAAEKGAPLGDFSFDGQLWFPKSAAYPLPNGLLMTFTPTADSWSIKVIEADQLANRNALNLANITPPLHGPSVLNINALDLALVAAGKMDARYGQTRTLQIAATPKDHKNVWDMYQCLSAWGTHDCGTLPASKGWTVELKITDVGLVPQGRGAGGSLKPPTFDHIAFHVTGTATTALSLLK
jgi:hypothetical protein